MVAFSLAMWRRYSSLTRRFKKKAVDTIIWHRRQKDTIRD
jgi:hypothetical protein